MNVIQVALPPSVTRTKMFRSLREHLQKDLGFVVNVDKTTPNYTKKWRASNNLISWGVKWSTKRYKAGGKNVLHIENGLYHQNSGVSCDHMGYFYDSSIVQEKKYFIQPSTQDLTLLKNQTKRCFKVDYDHTPKYNPNGPILVCLQLNGDASMLHHFPLCKGSQRNDYFIQECIKNLPKNHPVILRFHPRDKRKQTRVKLPKHWTINNSGRFMDQAKKCSALVVVNSTVATEALCLGIPIATFGQSTFYGSQTTLDCSRRSANVNGIFDFKADWDKIDSYLCAILRGQLMFNYGKDKVLQHESVQKFIQVALGRTERKLLPVKNKEEKPEEPKRLCDTAVISFEGCGGLEFAKALSKNKKCGRIGIFSIDDLEVDTVLNDKKCKIILIIRKNLFEAYVDNKIGRGNSNRCNVDLHKIKRWMVYTRQLVSELHKKCHLIINYEDINDDKVNEVFLKMGIGTLDKINQEVKYPIRDYKKVVPNYSNIISQIDDLIGLSIDSKKVATRLRICRYCKKPKVDQSSKNGKCKHCGHKNE